MDTQLFEKLENNLSDLKQHQELKKIKALNINQLERIISRLKEFSSDCGECREFSEKLLKITDTLVMQQELIDKITIKEYNTVITKLISHFHNKHKLVQEGFYIGIFMCFGVSLGLIYGNLFGDNIALGLPLGVCLGFAIGSAFDADARKKGKII